jgi:hypothetical protein
VRTSMEGKIGKKMRTMNLWKNRLYMKPVLTKEWQTDKLTYQTDIAKAQSAQRDKGIKACHTMHVNSLSSDAVRTVWCDEP